MRLTIGNTVLMIVGLLGLIFVYSLRPPAGFGELFAAAARGQEFYLKGPVYYVGLLLFGILVLVGLIRTVRSS